MEKEFVHPETQQGEVFFMNSNAKGFGAMGLETKRMGSTTYDGEGNRISHDDWSPVFIQQKEIDSQELSLMDLRRKWREEH